MKKKREMPAGALAIGIVILIMSILAVIFGLAYGLHAVIFIAIFTIGSLLIAILWTGPDIPPGDHIIR